MSAATMTSMTARPEDFNFTTPFLLATPSKMYAT
jgi:hypothetical protein